MSASEPASSGAAVSSTSSSIPPIGLLDAIGSKRTSALRQSIRGMEAQLVDLVCESLTPEGLMGWLRVPLECAASTGNEAAIKQLLAAGVNTGASPQQSRRPPLLHLAAKGGRAGALEKLLQAGVDVHETDSARGNKTALHCAADAGSESAVRALACAGADVGAMAFKGWTPLHFGCSNGNRSVVRFLLLNGACAQQETGDGHPPLHLAAMRNHPGVIEDLLALGNVSAERCNTDGVPALRYAAAGQRVEACDALLRGGASLDLETLETVASFDFAASSEQAGRLLQVLTSTQEASVRMRMCSEALYFAVASNQPDTIRDLAALGADVDYPSGGFLPYLHGAATRGELKAVEALLQAGANIEARCDGRTPLHLACINSRACVVELLLYWGADENATDDGNNTPSDVVGTHVPNADEEVLPVEFARNQRTEAAIRSMLKTAPADRTWRRRGWLVICRARWLSKIGAREVTSSSLLGSTPDGATGSKKRRGEMPGSRLVVTPNDVYWDKGKTHRRGEGGGRHLPEAKTPAAEVLRFGLRSVLNDEDSGQAAEIAGAGGGARFVAAVEELLLLPEDPIFREVVAFL